MKSPAPESGQSASAELACLVRSAEGTAFEGSALAIAMPTGNGQIQVLPGHAEAFIALAAGQVVINRPDGQAQRIEIINGSCWVKDDRVCLLF